jgi:chemotaxis protein MotB
MAPARTSSHRRRATRARAHGRAAAFVLLSALVHVTAYGAALRVWRPGQPDEPLPSRLVLVDLVPPSPTSVSAQPLPAEQAQDEARKRDEAEEASSALAQRLTELSAENVELAARVRDQEQRMAQLEAEHRAALAARDTAASELGEELGAVVADRDALSRQLTAARERAAALEQELDTQRRVEEAAKDEVAATYDRLVRALQAEIAAKDVALERANARVTVAIVERVLFPSGQARLTSDGERVVDKLGAALAGVSDRRILVEGHTDDMPIGPELRARFASNWELSTARATAVVKRLIDQANIPPGRLQATGRADTDPVATNETDEGRRLNRRIEIILLPPETGPDTGPTS